MTRLSIYLSMIIHYIGWSTFLERSNINRARLLPSFVRLSGGLNSDFIRPIFDIRRSLKASLEALMLIIRRVSVLDRALVRKSNRGFESVNNIKGMQHPVVRSNSCLRVTPRSNPSANAKHSSAILNLVTRLLLYDLSAMTEKLPVASASNKKVSQLRSVAFTVVKWCVRVY